MKLMPPVSLEIPKLRAMARHALPNIIEGTLVPLGLFYVAMWMVGVWGALGVALAWSYGAIAVRVASGRRVPGILVLAALGLTVRTAIALASQSVFIYFLQPSLGTAAVAAVFLLSVPAGKPLAQKLAGDFCPLPDNFAAHPKVESFFARISVLWGFVFMANAGLTIWLLTSQPLEVYLVARYAVSLGLTGSAIALSTVWFLRSMRAHGINVTRTPANLPAAVPAAVPAPFQGV